MEVGAKLIEVKNDMKLVGLALKEIKSDKIKKVLELALVAGNYLNSGGKNGKGAARGFKMDALLKVSLRAPVCGDLTRLFSSR
jgi:hypothetical protein